MINISARKIFIIAEAGVNHNADPALAKRMIDAAKLAGADAIKFQSFKAEGIATAGAKKAEYQAINTQGGPSQLEMLKRLELSPADLRRLAEYARKKRIIFLCSPFDKESVDLLNKIGVAVFKIPSGEITNIPLLEYIAAKHKPVILSTGMSTLEEIKAAVKVLKSGGVKDITLLHCVSEYPVKAGDVNLKAIKTLQDEFRLPVGFSDHSMGMAAAVASVALGVRVIEKHFTLSRRMPGPDHKASLEPAEFRQMVLLIRQAEEALGSGIKKPTKNEEKIKRLVRKSIVAKTDIPCGCKLTSGIIVFKRPGTGISPADLGKVLGRAAKRAISKDSLISFKDLE